MTGAAVVDSPHAYSQIRSLFIEQYLSARGLPSFTKKGAWQSLVVCKATVEITQGDKRSSEQIHDDMICHYERWAKVMCAEDDAGCMISTSPGYLTETMFMTVDVKENKAITRTRAFGKKFWRKWGLIKRSIINFENGIVKKTIASMPGGALPSGTDWELFVTRLVYYYYLNSKIDQEVDE